MMIPLNTLLPFFAASVFLAVAPGPDNIFVLTQSALHGKNAGIAVVFGLCTGLVAHSTAVALGVAVIFQTSAMAFSLLKYAGAAYLLYLAWQVFRAPAAALNMKQAGEIGLWRLYRRGILMNITNPKVSIFFLAFLPQFASPARGPLPSQLLLLGGVFILATLLVFGGIAFLAGMLGQWLNRSTRIQNVMNKLTGTIFVCLALKLATTD
jgi:threonine/homoserine/homoserine lactone efflux protein